MGTFFEDGGVRTWYAEHGAGAPLVYLHGGFSDASEVEPALPRYGEKFRVFTPERRGHGHTPDVEGPFDFETFARDTIAFLDGVVGGPAVLVGFSDGATTALHVALARPDLVEAMVMISGQFSHGGLRPEMFGTDVDEAVDGLVGAPLATRYAEVSPDGAGHFAIVAEKVVRMAAEHPDLAADRLAEVRARTLVVCADDDVVTLEHTIALYRGLPDAELAVVPGTSHVLIMEKPDRVADLVLAFLTEEPVPTRLPMDRRP